MDIFNRLAPFIQDYIYENKWNELREVQIAAAKVIFDSDDNLLLSSGTASGKTEAAFLPVLTQLHDRPSKSVGILYISPLKALINDQFKRMEQLLLYGNIPVCKWHGDASVSKKNDLIKHPEGILQITPESLESLLMNKRGACIKLFSDLRFVIIDEVHHFMRDTRGIQVLCILERLQKLTNNYPRRIGLSATLGDLEVAKNWLNTGSYRNCSSPVVDEGKKKVMLYVERFAKVAQGNDDVSLAGDIAHFEYLFKMTMDRKTIIFANSREEIEFLMANLREIAKNKKAPDVYRVHHGNISSLLREQAEDEMKMSEEKMVIGATVTLELGIDIGSLDQVVQVGAPSSVSSFAQRLGRCGRRGQTAQLLFTFMDETQATAADTLGPINWGFIRLIAIIEMYTKVRWVEPLSPCNYPYALLYHQIMSSLKSNGELSFEGIKKKVLGLNCFKMISEEDFKMLIDHLLRIHQLQKVEDGGLIIGREGEKIVNHFQFYTVFIVPEYYLVKDENQSIGTVDKIYPVGVHFSLAGMTWETMEVNEKAKVIFVKKVPGISVVDWDVDFDVELHTKLVHKIRDIIANDTDYPYLSPAATERLHEIQYLGRNSGFLNRLITPLAENRYAIFPWCGTRQLITLYFLLVSKGVKCKMPWALAIYLEVHYPGSAEDLEQLIYQSIQEDIDFMAVALPEEIQVPKKYNEFIPHHLLKKQFVEDFLDFKGLKEELLNKLN